MTARLEPNPAAAREIARALIGAMRAHGTDRIFGLPGGGPNLEKLAAGLEAGLPFILAHGETAAAIMAGTYGHLTGSPGLAICTRGPGIASATNGLAQATLDRYPLVVVSDTVTADTRHRVGHQKFDQTALTAPVTKWSGTLGQRQPHAVADAAARLALAGPPGAVHLDLDPSAPGDAPPVAPRPVDTLDLTPARDMLAASRRPVVIVGSGAAPWAAGVRDFVAQLGAPVLTTYQAAGIIPEADTVGRFTGGATERPTLAAADLVVAIGVDTVEPMPFPWTYSVPVLALLAWPDPTDYFPDRVEAVGEIGDLLAQLTPPSTEWNPLTKTELRASARSSVLSAAGGGFSPLDAVGTMIEGAREGTVLTVDAGAHFLAVMPIWPVSEPGDLLISNGLATMGFAIPAAIGAALARPERPVLAIVGDGGASMTLAELETLARLGLDVTVAVFNDSALSLIEIKQTEGQGGPAAVRYRPTNFATIASGFGLASTVVATPTQLKHAMRRPGPALVDLRINPGAYRELIRVTRG